MTHPDAGARFEASREALKVIYYVIVGLAITQALDGVFLSGGSFVWAALLDRDHLPSLLLLLAFLPTVTRFVHGASIHLDVIHTGSYKVLFDFVGFFLQASLFYVMALSIHEGSTFALIFGVILLADAGWLCILRWVGYLKFGNTEWQWIGSDLIILMLLLTLWYWFDRSLASTGSAAVILTLSWIATVTDYSMNRRFYFPTDERAVATAG